MMDPKSQEINNLQQAWMTGGDPLIQASPGGLAMRSAARPPSTGPGAPTETPGGQFFKRSSSGRAVYQHPAHDAVMGR
jgi:hypothetical protein